jgi:hypothetical protein
VSFEAARTDPNDARPGTARLGHHEERRAARPWHLATGSLACPGCDAPVVLGAERAGVTDQLSCPFCAHASPLRDFLSLAQPPRAPRVHVLVRTPA